MTYKNSISNNIGGQEGNLTEFFNDLKFQISKNSGNNSFSNFSEEFHEKDIPLPIGEKTQLMLTHPNHIVSQFETGFINMEIEFEVGFAEKFPGKIVDNAAINQIFIGFKDAVEIISEAKFYCQGRLISEYYQNETIRENYAYNSIRSKESKMLNPRSHSLWENVIQMSPNVCGVYIPLNELFWDEDSDTQKWKKIKMELIIPFTDQMSLQAWQIYPNIVIGDIVEEIKTSLEGLVWCQIPPKNVGELKKKWDYDPSKEYTAPDLALPNHFIPINQEGRIVGMMKSDETYAISSKNQDACRSQSQLMQYVFYEMMNNKLIIRPGSKPMITKGRTNCFGFDLKDEDLGAINAMCQEEIYIPAQEISRVFFDQKANQKGLNCTKMIPISNASKITMMFPKTPFDCVCYQNVMYRDVQLVLDKKIYPRKEFRNTWDGRFVQHQLMANELDGVEAPPEFMESIGRPLNNVDENDSGERHFERFYSCPYDNTNFGIHFQLKRGRAGYCFDGIDSANKVVKIDFQGLALPFPPADIKNDTYLYPETDELGEPKEKDEQPQQQFPEMWICSDTYWIWSKRYGVEYRKDGIPPGRE